MKRLKNILMAGLVALVTVVTASAQQYGVIGTIAGGGTYNGPASGTTNINGTITATKWAEFALAIDFALVGAGSTALDIAWTTSVDGTNWATTKDPYRAGWFSITPNGTSAVSWNTNITMNSVGYWKMTWITNGSASAITNLSIRAIGKPKRQG